jgi:signal transduction histidine kinase
VPIVRRGGQFFGTLCAIDPKPARVDTPAVRGMFKLFAEMIAFHLDANERLADSEASLLDERHTSDLREQFIAVLGHDLRNPLAAIDSGAKLLRRTERNGRDAEIIALILSSVERMSGLIANVLDFARGRLGGGLRLNLDPGEALGLVLDQVVAESRAAWPDRQIKTDIRLSGPVSCDSARMAQLASNLLGNALAYGDADKPILVQADTAGGAFSLSVANSGEPIPPEVLTRMFEPFARGDGKSSQKGLGLGLYIASEVARAHGGNLSVTSTVEQTCFTLRMPLV